MRVHIQIKAKTPQYILLVIILHLLLASTDNCTYTLYYLLEAEQLSVLVRYSLSLYFHLCSCLSLHGYLKNIVLRDNGDKKEPVRNIEMDREAQIY